MRGLQHTNVLRIYDFYELDAGFYYMVVEHMHGGELFRRIGEKVMVLCARCVFFVILCLWASATECTHVNLSGQGRAGQGGGAGVWGGASGRRGSLC